MLERAEAGWRRQKSQSRSPVAAPETVAAAAAAHNRTTRSGGQSGVLVGVDINLAAKVLVSNGFSHVAVLDVRAVTSPAALAQLPTIKTTAVQMFGTSLQLTPCANVSIGIGNITLHSDHTTSLRKATVHVFVTISGVGFGVYVYGLRMKILA